MNRYPLWKYAILGVALLVGLLYTLPNFFGEAPAVQVSSGKATLKLDASVRAARRAVRSAQAGLKADFVQFDGNSVKARFADTDTQIKAKDAIAKALNPDPADPSYIVALNLLSRSPAWLTQAARAADVPGPGPARRRALPDAGRHEGGADQEGRVADRRPAHACCATRTSATPASAATARPSRCAFATATTLAAARRACWPTSCPTCSGSKAADGSDFKLHRHAQARGRAPRCRSRRCKQNITTLHNRVNELGVAEPVIQQQGADRVVVQLPGVQDTAKAKDIIGRTADAGGAPGRRERRGARGRATAAGRCPSARERFLERNGAPVIVNRQVIADRRQPDRRAGRLRRPDQEPAVHLTLDAKGGRASSAT